MPTSVNLSNLLPEKSGAEPLPKDWAQFARTALNIKAEKQRAQSELIMWLEKLQALENFAPNDFEHFSKITELTNSIAEYENQIKDSFRDFYGLIPASVIKMMRKSQKKLRLEDANGAMDILYDDDTMAFDVVPVAGS